MSLIQLVKKQLEVCGVKDCDRIAVGFSGGSDSTALLHSLAECVGCERLTALHVNHGIRGEEAQRDEDFCKGFCQNLGVAIECVHLDIPNLAKEEKTGIEECARNHRYKALFDCAERNGIRYIATAHNARDSVEAVIFNLCRGTGLKGLCGIPESREENGFTIIRPIIKADKPEIYAYLKENGLDYVTDSTNNSDDYTRNYIRHNIIPGFSRINPAYIENISNCTDILSNTERYISKQIDKFIVENTKDNTVDKAAFLSLDPALRNGVISRLSGVSLSYKMTSLLYDFAKKAENGQSFDVSADVLLIADADVLVFSKRLSTDPYKHKLYEGVNKFPDLGFTLYLFFDEGYKRENIYKTLKCTLINRDKLNGDVFIRNRTEGDRYKYGNMTRTPKKLLADKKIPAQLKKNYPVLCDDDGIICMPGFPPKDGLDGRLAKNKAVILYQSDV